MESAKPRRSESGTDSASDANRRTFLKAVGSAGAGSVGLSAMDSVSADSANETSALFAELGVAFEESTDTKAADQYDPAEFYRPTGDKLIFSAIKQSDLETFKNNDEVVRFNSVNGFPARFTRQEYTAATQSLNARLRPSKGVPLNQPVATPAIRLDSESNSITISVGGSGAIAAPGEFDSVELGPVQSESRTGEPFKATAKVVVKNYGTLDIQANTVLGGE